MADAVERTLDDFAKPRHLKTILEEDDSHCPAAAIVMAHVHFGESLYCTLFVSFSENVSSRVI